MFKAAEPAVFEWYVKNYGPEISLFADHSQIVQLECLRSGIWSDAPGTAEQRKQAARRTMRRFEAAARGRAKRPPQEEVEGLLCRAYSAMSDQ